MTANMHMFNQNQAIMKKQLAANWSKVKSKRLSVASIVEEDKRENIAQLLENYKQLPGTIALMEEQNGMGGIDSSNLGGSQMSTTGMFGVATADPDAYRFRPIEMALTRRAYADMAGHNFVGVQAMNGPVGLAYALRFFYDGTDIESGFQHVGQYSGWSGRSGIAGTNAVQKITNATVLADIKASGKMVSELVDAATGLWKVTWTGASTATYTAGAAVTGFVAGAWGRALQVSDAEKLGIVAPSAGTAPTNIGTAIPNATTGTNPYAMRQIKMRFDRKAIEAMDRMLAASFSVQSNYDIRTMQGIDIGREMVKHLSYEISAETDRELIWKCKNTAVFGDGGQNGAVEVFDPTTIESTFLHDRMISVANKIISLSNEIHTATIRGAGNVCLVSPHVSTILQTAQNTSFKATGAYEVNAGNSLIEVGTLDHGKIKVYRDPWAYFDGGVDYALIGYKGPGIDDAGVLWHPYLLNLVNTATNQQDFSTAIGVMSRYAVTDNLLGSGRFYRYIEFASLSALGV